MFSDKITYEDFNGNSVTEEVFFNISKMEALELENEYPGGFAAHLQEIVDSEDNKRIFEAFKDLVKRTYGVKSEDGKRFIKSEEEFFNFQNSPVYDEFMMKLISDDNYALDFILGAMPSIEGVTKESVLQSLKNDQLKLGTAN